MYETIDEALRAFYRNEEVAARIGEFEKMVLADRKSSFVAARELRNDYFGKIGK